LAYENASTVVQCTRYSTPGDAVNIPFSYKFFQFFYRSFVRAIFGRFVSDSTYAFKLFRRAEVLALGMTANRFAISPEITFKALLSRRRVDFIRGSQGQREHGVSKFKFFREGPGFVYCLARAALHKTRLALWF
jgi:hypothetical protein